MSYPKPLSKKSLDKMYLESKLTPIKIIFLRSLFEAVSNLYGTISLSHLWDVYKVLLSHNKDIPKIQRKDIISFSSIARREEHTYYVFEEDELYTDGKKTDIWRQIVNKFLVSKTYGKFYMLYNLMDKQGNKPYFIPDNLLDYAEPRSSHAEKALRKFLNSLKVNATERTNNNGKYIRIENYGKTLKEFDFLNALERYSVNYYKNRPSVIAEILENTKGPESQKIMRIINRNIQLGDNPQGVIQYLTRELEEVGVLLNEKQLNELLNLYMDYNNTSHLMSNRGWSPDDLHMEHQKNMPAGAPPFSSISFGPGIQNAIANGEMDEKELTDYFNSKGITIIKQ